MSRRCLGCFDLSSESDTSPVPVGYGTMVIPMLAARVSTVRDVVVRPLAAGVGRTVRLVSRKSFQRGPALHAVADVIREAANNAIIECQERLAVRSGPERVARTGKLEARDDDQ